MPFANGYRGENLARARRLLAMPTPDTGRTDEDAEPQTLSPFGPNLDPALQKLSVR
jgi:hypothetical protein